MKRTVFLLLMLAPYYINAKDTTAVKSDPVSISAYVETYYCYDFGSPVDHTRPSFFYSFNRHNEVNLNLGFIKANYNTDKVRGNLAFMAGTYSQYNLAHEQGLLKNIFEANAGLNISKRNNLWLDLGILPSHIGFESAIGKDCWNLTRSILADNSPYYESGAKLGFTSNSGKLYMAAMYLNGWQRIQRLPYNQTPAFGTQVTFKPGSNITLNYSTYAGNEQADTLKQWRFFQNFYGQFQLTAKLGLIVGFDIGTQQKRDTVNILNGNALWYSPVLIVRYSPLPKIKIAARVEYYEDKDGVMIKTGTPNGFQTYGYSLNFDYTYRDNILWRIEGRGLVSKDDIFMFNKKPSTTNFFVTTSLALAF